jgi:hypothetical protein
LYPFLQEKCHCLSDVHCGYPYDEPFHTAWETRTWWELWRASFLEWHLSTDASTALDLHHKWCQSEIGNVWIRKPDQSPWTHVTRDVVVKVKFWESVHLCYNSTCAIPYLRYYLIFTSTIFLYL